MFLYNRPNILQQTVKCINYNQVEAVQSRKPWVTDPSHSSDSKYASLEAPVEVLGWPAGFKDTWGVISTEVRSRGVVDLLCSATWEGDVAVSKFRSLWRWGAAELDLEAVSLSSSVVDAVSFGVGELVIRDSESDSFLRSLFLLQLLSVTEIISHNNQNFRTSIYLIKTMPSVSRLIRNVGLLALHFARLFLNIKKSLKSVITGLLACYSTHILTARTMATIIATSTRAPHTATTGITQLGSVSTVSSLPTVTESTVPPK